MLSGFRNQAVTPLRLGFLAGSSHWWTMIRLGSILPASKLGLGMTCLTSGESDAKVAGLAASGAGAGADAGLGVGAGAGCWGAGAGGGAALGFRSSRSCVAVSSNEPDQL